MGCQQTLKLLGDEAKNQGECRSYVHGTTLIKEGEWKMGLAWPHSASPSSVLVTVLLITVLLITSVLLLYMQ